MLAKSFLHFPGIGPKRERELWRSGIYCWDDFFSRGARQLHLFCDSSGSRWDDPLAAESKLALAQGDTSFFARLLPKSEHYRIAVAFPSNTLFLDIETTGLSRYYNEITLVGWSVGAEYKALIRGEPIDELLGDLAAAKAIVTFNGTMFDLPFILDAWPDTPIPDAHVDLRFLCKRVGLTGGQKEVEKEIGKRRAAGIRDMQGEAAPLLWYRYRHGDSSALKKLIEYNHADVEGMKRIFDVAVKRLCRDNQVPVRARPEENFSRYRSKLTWASKNGAARPGIRIEPYPGPVGPSLRYEELAPSLGSEELRVVGIDLSGGEARHSGWCLLEGARATTGRLYTDSEILRATVGAKPHLVSIDSPLSLPEGRVSVSDDDPGREEYGILRRCERTLKKRGVNVYPCLLPSMQNLTARGIRLAKELRAMGIPVIESYPGAAQDIMDIPRKGQSVELLAFGLR
ncbi:MAG: DUF429 domain-containing protein, partial [Proteobacteria bacterium]|nr:DUF429 domain-containing protein [Pseudomonadota bacterium]